MLSSTLVKDLKKYYNNQAKKYSQTRKKFWIEKPLLQEALIQYFENYDEGSYTFRILEFGCGDGRFFREVLCNIIENIEKKNKKIFIEYTGIDISSGLLNIAQTDAEKYINKRKSKNITIQAKFFCEDILNYVKKCNQEHYDIIVGIASFQHIHTYNKRLYLIKYFYKLLKYDGILLMLNWSFSYWFIQKYWKEILLGIGKYLFSL